MDLKKFQFQQNSLVIKLIYYVYMRLHSKYTHLQNSLMSELKTRVEELKMENEYQLRLKDMNYNEKTKELTDKFLQEIEMLKARNEVRHCIDIYILCQHSNLESEYEIITSL